MLSGGAGTRLWPLSREALPKQFHDLVGAGQPLLVDTLRRLEGLGSIRVLTTEKLRFPTLGLLNRYDLHAEVVAEPQLRNTAPAVLLAARLAERDRPGSVVGVFPADHTIRDVAAFQKLVRSGFELAARGEVVTLGIAPDHPSTAYGYLEVEALPTPGAVKVKRFVEKPSVEKAQALLSSGHVVWNAGMFLFRSDVMIELFRKHSPKTAAAFDKLKPDLSNLVEVYAAVESQSVDFGIMEKLDSLVCLPADIGWSDIGSWEEIAKRGVSATEFIEVGGQGNFCAGLWPRGKKVAFVGVTDLIAVDTPDALLVLKKGEGQKVREAVERLRANSSQVVSQHVFEERPWGRFEILKDTENFKSKIITVLPGQKLSYQSHAKRAENWTIVRGLAEVTLNDKIHSLKVGEHIHIPLGAKHRIANPGTTPMEFIEVQTGAYFGEDDIVRYSDEYGRKS